MVNSSLSKYLKDPAELSLIALVNLPAALTGNPYYATIGPVITTVINKCFSRNLSQQEEFKLKFATAYLIEEIQSRTDSGKKIRTDGFFDRADVHRSSAEQVLEGTLLKCKNQFIDKKLMITSNIFISAIYNEGVSLDDVETVLAVTEKLTYRELCLLAIFSRKDELDLDDLREGDFSNGSWRTEGAGLESTPAVLQNICNLINTGTLSMLDENHAAYIEDIITWNSVVPSRIVVTPIGEQYLELLNLSIIDKKDLDKFIKYLV